MMRIRQSHSMEGIMFYIFRTFSCAIAFSARAIPISNSEAEATKIALSIKGKARLLDETNCNNIFPIQARFQTYCLLTIMEGYCSCVFCSRSDPCHSSDESQ